MIKMLIIGHIVLPIVVDRSPIIGTFKRLYISPDVTSALNKIHLKSYKNVKEAEFALSIITGRIIRSYEFTGFR